MEQVLTLPGEVERWAHYGTEYVKADDYAALNDYAALVQMERDMARAEVERLRAELTIIRNGTAPGAAFAHQQIHYVANRALGDADPTTAP